MGSRIKHWGGLSLVAVFLIFQYTPTFIALVTTWWGSDIYAHGFLIIPISLYLIWTKRADWISINPAPHLIGGTVLLVVSMGIFLLGRLGNLVTLEAVSFILTLAGMVLLILGKPYLTAWRFPIAYLLFMIPIDRLLLQNIHWPLQLFAANIGASFLNLFGFPTFIENQYIQLPNITLDVARACSGLNYLTAIIAIGMPLAYLSIKSVKWQVGLVLSSIVIAIVANGLRIAFAGVLGSLGYSIHGPAHILEGVVVAWIGFIALFVGAWLIARRESRSELGQPQLGQPQLGQPQGLPLHLLVKDPVWERATHAWHLRVIVILVLTEGVLFFGSPVKIPWHENKFEPIDGWHKEQASIESFPVRMETADHEEMAVFQDQTGVEMHYYSGYFERQSQGKEMIDITTARLHEDAQELIIPMKGMQSIRINKGIYERNQGRHLVLFWYKMDDQVVSSWLSVKRLTLWNALTKRKNNGAIVIVSARVGPQDTVAKILEKQVAFVSRLASL